MGSLSALPSAPAVMNTGEGRIMIKWGQCHLWLCFEEPRKASMCHSVERKTAESGGESDGLPVGGNGVQLHVRHGGPSESLPWNATIEMERM